MFAKVVAGALLAIVASRADAQPAVELWGAFSGVVAAPSGTLTSAYAPPLVFGTAVTSSAGQTLTFDASPRFGVQGGVNWFPSRHAGVQILVDRTTIDLTGANGPYGAAIEYVALQPPDYVPRTYTTGYSKAWPDTSGSLTQLTIGVNAVARTAQAGPVTATVSGGLAWTRFTGAAQALGYTEYHLGGHSTLFYEEMQLAFELGPSSTIGYNLGGDISVALGGHAAIVAGYRYIDAGTIDLPVTPTEVINAGQVTFEEPIDTISHQMHTGPARFTGGSSRIVVGLKVGR